MSSGRSTIEYQERLSKAMKSAMGTPEMRLAISRRTQKLWENPDYKAKVNAARRAKWAEEAYRTKLAQTQARRTTVSILEQLVVRLLAERGIEAGPTQLGPWTFDIHFELRGRGVLIECQGDHWHRQPATAIRDKQKNTYYNRYLAKDYDLSYIYEFEFYGQQKIASIVDGILGTPQSQIPFNLEDVVINGDHDRAETDRFLWSYHYLGRSRSCLPVAATIDGKLIAVLCFANCTRQQTPLRLGKKPEETLELIRFCVHPNYRKKNFASWLLARSMKFIPASITTIISFADAGAGHSGTVYKAAGWRLDGLSNKSYWYIDQEGHRYHKKSVWDQAQRLKMNESQYADEMGLNRIIGKPLQRFVKVL